MEPSGTIDALLVSCTSVYGWRRGDRYLYIGASNFLFRRLASHHVIDIRDKIEAGDVIDYWLCRADELFDVEARLIDLYKPVYNEVVLRSMEKEHRLKHALPDVID